MDKTQLIFGICFVTLLVMLLTGFLLFVILWQRRRHNSYISEKERMEIVYREQLLTSQLEIQEQVFNDISMEIHDNVGQTLSLLKVQLNIMEEVGLFDRTALLIARDNAGKAMSDLRDIAKSLSSDRISELNLLEMIDQEAARIRNSCRLSVEVLSEGEERNIADNKKMIVFRIIQESLQNIVKHARATEVSVRVTHADDELRIAVIDNGRGFAMDTTAKGLGLRNIISRAAIIGGKASVDSLPEVGTTINVIVPYG